MRFLTFIFLVIMTVCVGHMALAQEDNSTNNSTQIDQSKLDDLIGTLENEEARADFLENLKTLSETKEKQDDSDNKPFLDLSDKTGDLVSEYEQFVANLGMSEGLFGQFVATAAVLIIWLILTFIVRKLAHVLRDRLNLVRDHFQLRHDRFRLYARYIRYAGYIVVTVLAFYTLEVIWNVTGSSMTMGAGSQAFVVTIINIILITVLAIVIWEVINTSIENYLCKLDASHSNRLRTLIPIIRNALLVAFVILFTLVLLSEIGVNVLPLLAGAGVLGLAIGLGAQTMIKDFLTGFTIIIEDLIQVGDVASLGGKIGVIEKITIRKVQLRDLAGIVYTVPFSEITIVENWTKDFSYYVMDIGVAYRENTDEVVAYLKEVDEDMRSDDNYKDLILGPLEILGVDAFADSAVIIKARIKTKPIQQWTVGREFNRRMKIKFDAMGVEIPFPHQTLYFGHDKDGNAPAAPLKILGNESGNK